MDNKKELQDLQRSHHTIGASITTLWDLAETLPYGHSAERLVREAEKLLYEARTIVSAEIEKKKPKPIPQYVCDPPDGWV